MNTLAQVVSIIILAAFGGAVVWAFFSVARAIARARRDFPRAYRAVRK